MYKTIKYNNNTYNYTIYKNKKDLLDNKLITINLSHKDKINKELAIEIINKIKIKHRIKDNSINLDKGILYYTSIFYQNIDKLKKEELTIKECDCEFEECYCETEEDCYCNNECECYNRFNIDMEDLIDILNFDKEKFITTLKSVIEKYKQYENQNSKYNLYFDYVDYYNGYFNYGFPNKKIAKAFIKDLPIEFFIIKYSYEFYQYCYDKNNNFNDYTNFVKILNDFNNKKNTTKYIDQLLDLSINSGCGLIKNLYKTLK